LAQNIGLSENLSALNTVSKHLASPSSGIPPWFPEKPPC
jgi:hypothetical protein